MTDVKDVKGDEGSKEKKKSKKQHARRPKIMRGEMYFEIGRLCSINYGPDNGKICVILDFVDNTRALIDGPACRTGVQRQTIPFSRLSLTRIKIKIYRACRTGLLIKAFDEAQVLKYWERTPWAIKAHKKKIRRTLTDFDRFKVMVLQMRRGYLIRRKIAQLHKWRKLAKSYKPGTTDEPEKLMAAKRCIFGMKRYRDLKNLKKGMLEYDLKKPISAKLYKRMRSCGVYGAGFEPRKNMRRKRSKKKSKAKILAYVAHSKMMKKIRKIARRKVPRSEYKKKKPRKTSWLTKKQHKQKLKALFKGKTRGEVILLKRQFRQKRNYAKSLRIKEQKKKMVAKKQLERTALRKTRRETHIRRAAKIAARSAKDPEYKAKMEKVRAKRKEMKKKIKAVHDERRKKRAAKDAKFNDPKMKAERQAFALAGVKKYREKREAEKKAKEAEEEKYLARKAKRQEKKAQRHANNAKEKAARLAKKQ